VLVLCTHWRLERGGCALFWISREMGRRKKAREMTNLPSDTVWIDIIELRNYSFYKER
jgi:hypothetical protein